MNTLPDFKEEKALWAKGYDLVIGVDEVGRGCFAGPIVAGAVAFPNSHSYRYASRWRNDSVVIDDSKRLKPQERNKAAAWITSNCLAYGIGEIGVATINREGIGKATTMAMRKAIAELISKHEARNSKQIQKSKPKKLNDFEFRISNFEFTKTFVLVDAFHIKYLRGIGHVNQKAIKKGDQRCISIAAASIVAKTFRDSLMQKFAKRYSIYGWGRNKGYGTRGHQEAILQNGITRLHRKAFVETFLASQGLALQGYIAKPSHTL